MKKVAIYYRVSTDKQDLDSQKQTVEQWLDALPNQPSKVTVYKDEGLSGKTSARPSYQELIKDAFSGKFDTIIVYRLDRFSRNANTAIKVLLDLDDHGVAFISVTQPVLNLGHDNPFRRTMLAALAEIAEIERETIVARVKSGLAAAKKRGVKLGAPVKVDAEMRGKILKLRKEGESLRSIAKIVGLSVGTVQQVSKAG